MICQMLSLAMKIIIKFLPGGTHSLVGKTDVLTKNYDAIS
jgi:hypothetical protein